jgi:GNAT superfamily N-acetyltransferase
MCLRVRPRATETRRFPPLEAGGRLTRRKRRIIVPNYIFARYRNVEPQSGRTSKGVSGPMGSQSSGVLRALRPADLDAVVEIDRRITGRSRRVFFERRLKAALADPAGFIAVAVDSDDACTGFAIARLQNGEFGDDRRVAVLDVIGVDPGQQGAGVGTLLLEGTTARMRKHDVHELRTQVDWRDQDLIRFFAAIGFGLAPRQVLERAVARELGNISPQEGARP